MRILFLVYHGFSKVSGISKKIHYQVKGLCENGHEVHLCYYDYDSNGHKCRFVDGEVIKNYGGGVFAGVLQRVDYSCIYDYCKQKQIEFVYARCFQNANPWLIKLFKRLKNLGVKTVTEIPTFPYDREFVTFSWLKRIELKIDQLFRHSLCCQMDAIVTFSDAERIFGQRTIRISNGVDFDSIPLHEYHPSIDGAIHLIGVAEVHLWHGYDRLIAGLGEYYRKHPLPNIIFHIVGGVDPFDMYGLGDYPGLQTLIDQYGLRNHVVFHGQLFGGELDAIFNQCCLAVGSLARHRTGISVIKTLKNREYASRGIPFIYSETDSDFDNKHYVLKVPPDETPIDINAVLDFICKNQFQSQEIRKTVENLSWKIQMKKVVDEA